MRRLTFALTVVAVAFIAGASLAIASDHPPDKAGAAAGHGNAAADDSPFAGEPQQILDLAIWTVVVFLLLVFVLGRFAWKPMLAGLQRRESNIRGALEAAQKARDEATTLRAQFQKEMDGAQQKVKEVLDVARRDAQVATDDMIAKAKTEIGAERERAQREIAVETDQALQTIWTKAADLATRVSAAALGKQLDTNMHRRLIDEALNELKTAARN